MIDLPLYIVQCSAQESLTRSMDHVMKYINPPGRFIDTTNLDIEVRVTGVVRIITVWRIKPELKAID
jgi:hypothetical protein